MDQDIAWQLEPFWEIAEALRLTGHFGVVVC